MRPLLTGFFLTGALLSSHIAAAQQFHPRSITFSGYSAPTPELLAAAALKPDSALTQADMQTAAQRLSETGLFDNVRFSFDGQTLHYDLKPANNALPSAFENFPWWDAKTLEDRLESAVPLFHGTLPPESGMQTRLVAALTAMLAEQKVTATVSASQHNDVMSGKATAVAFRIDNPPIKVGTVSFSGETPAWTEQLNGIAKAAGGQDFDTEATPRVLRQAVEHVYKNKGYLDAHVTSDEKQLPIVEADKVSVPISVSLIEGEQYHLGQITLTGSVLMDQDTFLKAAKLKSGDVLEEDKLRQTMQTLSRPYVTRGYLHAAIRATPEFDHVNHVVNYSITVVPGEPCTMGSFEANGLNDEQKALVAGVWKMKAGDPFDATYPPSFLTSNKESLRALNGYAANYKQIEHLDTHVVDLVVTFAKTKQ